MNYQPIRLVVGDDLNRKRLTVFFRWLLAIPHLIWIGLWGILAFLVVIANWLATLVAGHSPAPLHNFLASYVKYVTQVYGYVSLAADPYPPFDGRAGYPVDVSIAPPQRQNRWTVAFRAILALPAGILAATLTGSPGWGSGSSGQGSGLGSYFYSGSGLLHTVAFLGWFAILARGRMPRGLRDAATYALAYGAQLWAYAFMLTDRYPNSDPLIALGDLPVRADPIRIDVGGDLRRSRLTVFFRVLLAFPHLIWLALWGVLALLAAIANWLATLFAGRSPVALHRFLSAYIRYQAHVYAFLYLIGNPFPGFVGKPGSYPVEPAIEEPSAQNRWTVAFRLVLAVPTLLIATAYGGVATTAAVLGWLASIATGEMPAGLRNVLALALRYLTQSAGYLFLLTDAYPYSGPCLNPSQSPVTPTPSTPLPEWG